MIPLGLSSATNTRVANALGAGAGGAARLAFIVAGGTVLCSQALLAAVSLLGRSAIIAFFSNSPDVEQMLRRALPVVQVGFVADGVTAVMSGVLRGAGRQDLGAGLNLMTFWAFGVPLAALIGLRLGLGVVGFWLGLVSSSAAQAMLLTLLISRFDWAKEVKRAQALVAQQQAAADGVDGQGDDRAFANADEEAAAAAVGGVLTQRLLLQPPGGGSGGSSRSVSGISPRVEQQLPVLTLEGAAATTAGASAVPAAAAPPRPGRRSASSSSSSAAPSPRHVHVAGAGT